MDETAAATSVAPQCRRLRSRFSWGGPRSAPAADVFRPPWPRRRSRRSAAGFGRAVLGLREASARSGPRPRRFFREIAGKLSVPHGPAMGSRLARTADSSSHLRGRSDLDSRRLCEIVVLRAKLFPAHEINFPFLQALVGLKALLGFRPAGPRLARDPSWARCRPRPSGPCALPWRGRMIPGASGPPGLRASWASGLLGPARRAAPSWARGRLPTFSHETLPST